MRRIRTSLSGIAIAALVAGMAVSAAGGQSAVVMPDEIKAVIQKNCAVCHKGKHPPRKLNLESSGLPASIVDMPSAEQPGLKLIDSESPGSSYLLMKVRGAEGISGKRMPPPVKPALTPEEMALLENWILGLKEPGLSRMTRFGFNIFGTF
jgi:mono/diheme cytochrome c family protein